MTEARLKIHGVSVTTDYAQQISVTLHDFQLIHSPEFDGPVVLNQQSLSNITRYGTVSPIPEKIPVEGVPPIQPGQEVVIVFVNPDRRSDSITITHDPVPKIIYIQDTR